MLLERYSTSRAGTVWTVLILCLCILMQMLGTTMTLWDLEFQLDPVNAPLLEGYSLPTVLADASLLLNIAVLAISSETLQKLLRSHGLFRPPNSLV